MSTTTYYHAGAGQIDDPDGIVWSDRTHADYASAASEAIGMATRGGRPIVESWDASHGERPSDADAVDTCEYVDVS